METIFISHKVEHPMTVICSAINEEDVWGDWNNPFAFAERKRKFIPSETYVYNVWVMETLNGKKINSHSPLN